MKTNHTDTILLKKYTDTLDSARFRGDSAFVKEQYTHAFIECILSILFGQRIMLTENQLFDSVAFLYFASEVLQQWEKKKQKLADSSFGFPFGVVFRRNEPYKNLDFRTTLYNLFSQTHQTGRPFVLSAWPEVDGQHQARMELADLFKKGEFTAARKVTSSIGYQKLHALELIDHYLDYAPADAVPDSRPPTVPMPASLNALLDFTEKELEQIATYHQELAKEISLKSPSLNSCLDEAIELLCILKKLVEQGLDTNARGDLYLEEEIDKLEVEEHQLLGLREIYNTCYNNALASAARSNMALLSNSYGDISKQWVSAGSLLGQFAVTSCKEQDCEPTGQFSRGLEIQMTGFTKKGYKLFDKAMPIEFMQALENPQLITEVVNILSTPEWQDSARKLNQALSKNDRVLADERLHSHVELISKDFGKHLIDLVNVGEGKIQLSIPVISKILGASPLMMKIVMSPSSVPTTIELVGEGLSFLLPWLVPAAKKVALKGQIKTEFTQALDY